MTVYSFRAECKADLKRLSLALRTSAVRYSIRAARDRRPPDCAAEIETDASLETIREVMRELEDSHVMLQTLRACPLSQNSLERDFDLE